jgi:methylenetetrahydrofolate dehydrogenase (NADP+) / methenyltetrahydrofolate cyclohydrolase
MPPLVIDPGHVAEKYRSELRAEIAQLPERLKLVGLLVADHGPSRTYAEYTRKGCDDVGVAFDLQAVPRLGVEPAIRAANADPSVHGVLVYYPVFGTEQDGYLRDLIDPGKDIEGLHSFWARCLYENRRYYDAGQKKKSILPCTPLAVLKLLDAAGVIDPSARSPLAGRRVCVFNRSEVVGRPLAAMMANDGAEVVSFDIDGPLLFVPDRTGNAHEVRETAIDRTSALADADIVVTGVPSRSFERIQASEIREDAVCLNFSTLANYDESAVHKARVFIPRVGPMTVTMALRNTLRLYQNSRLAADVTG